MIHRRDAIPRTMPRASAHGRRRGVKGAYDDAVGGATTSGTAVSVDDVVKLGTLLMLAKTVNDWYAHTYGLNPLGRARAFLGRCWRDLRGGGGRGSGGKRVSGKAFKGKGRRVGKK